MSLADARACRDQARKLLAKIRLVVEISSLAFIRSSELRFARWPEVDFETAMWTLPGERETPEGVKYHQRSSKMRTLHFAPLSRQALAVWKRSKV